MISARLRKLQQGADPNAGYAKAARLIFTNIFDYFRANGELCMFSQRFIVKFIAKRWVGYVSYEDVTVDSAF